LANASDLAESDSCFPVRMTIFLPSSMDTRAFCLPVQPPFPLPSNLRRRRAPTLGNAFGIVGSSAVTTGLSSLAERAIDLAPRALRGFSNIPGRPIVLAKTAAFEQLRHDRKRVEMLFAHLKRILKLGRLRLRGPRGAQDEFTLAAIAQNLRRLAKLAAQQPPCPRGKRQDGLEHRAVSPSKPLLPME
jgi:Transposase DDE domain